MIARILVLAILLGGLPLAATEMLANSHAAPAFTLDICQPLASFDIAQATCTLAMPPPFALLHRPIDLHVAAVYFVRSSTLAPEAPDPPPPKLLSSF